MLQNKFSPWGSGDRFSCVMEKINTQIKTPDNINKDHAQISFPFSFLLIILGRLYAHRDLELSTLRSRYHSLPTEQARCPSFYYYYFFKKQ